MKELPEHGPGVWSLGFSPDGTKLACCGREAPLIISNWQDGTKLSTNPKAGECLVWLPGGSRLIFGNVLDLASLQPQRETLISFHDPSDGTRTRTVLAPGTRPNGFAVSRDGRYVVTAQQDGVALILDRDQPAAPRECRGHQGAIRDVCFHPNDASFITGGLDGTVRIWSADGSEQYSLPQSGAGSAVAVSPDGTTLAAGIGRTAALWNLAQKQVIHALSGHYGEVCHLNFSADGSRLASTSRTYFNDRWQGDLKIWNVSSGKRTLSVPSHTWWNAAVAFHPDGTQVATDSGAD